jgi:hypothetical protein
LLRGLGRVFEARRRPRQRSGKLADAAIHHSELLGRRLVIGRESTDDFGLPADLRLDGVRPRRQALRGLVLRARRIAENGIERRMGAFRPQLGPPGHNRDRNRERRRAPPGAQLEERTRLDGVPRTG